MSEVGIWFYLSFAGRDGWLGASIVGPCADFIEAVCRSHERGCNGGGEVMGWEIPECELARLSPSLLHRFFDRQTIHELAEAWETEMVSSRTGKALT